MIVPMKKVSLVVMEKSRESSLEKLREAGVLHLEKRNVRSDELTRLLDRKAKTETALGILRSYPAEKGASAETPVDRGEKAGIAPQDLFSSGQTAEEAPPDLVARILELGDEKKTLQEQLVVNAKERSRIENWGNFDPRAFGEFAEKGIVLIPYELPLKVYESLSGELILLGRDKGDVRLLSVGKEIPGESPWVLPERSLAEIDALIADIRNKLADIENQLQALGSRKASLETEQKLLLERIEFETARAGMETVADAPEEFTVSWITGFVPQDELGVLKRAAAENGWALMADDPGADDTVPTKLKNNRLAALIRPLTDFLEVVPGYNEIDISGFFLFFFVIFFGMIFGDAGYGALIILAAGIGILTTAKKGVPPILKLLLLLGLSNFTWGFLTCSWFGIKAALVPDALKSLSLPLISNAVADRSAMDKAIVQQNLMIFCFSLALLQLSIGHILAIIHHKSLKILGHIGSIAMLGGMYFIILSLIASNEARQIPLYPLAIYCFAGGFLLNFVFASYEGSIGRSILESLKNIISVILGIANIFSDIMSYIRLWAVGLAGAAIADTVDTMAAQIGGLAGPVVVHFMVFILAGFLLIFGHGLNLILNVLSVLVHGVRLNTLEFSGHVGLTWAGTAYKPFAKTAVRAGDR
ncbi:MAG: V-type ATP synthase subunit I [Spirochaetaceae bacterium]|jgi:V/A-type H+-transporting ATPase subunit I|nr:V-type ATP synthase subunit I [Spirochaetaceae bacterium]